MMPCPRPYCYYDEESSSFCFSEWVYVFLPWFCKNWLLNKQFKCRFYLFYLFQLVMHSRLVNKTFWTLFLMPSIFCASKRLLNFRLLFLNSWLFWFQFSPEYFSSKSDACIFVCYVPFCWQSLRHYQDWRNLVFVCSILRILRIWLVNKFA